MDSKDVCREIGWNISRLFTGNSKYSDYNVYLFGENPFTEYILNELEKNGINCVGIIDNGRNRWGKRIGKLKIASPRLLIEEKKVLILIASAHIDAMKNQLTYLVPDAEVLSLFDFRKWNDRTEYRKFFWQVDNYELEKKKLYIGKDVYERVKGEDTIYISPTSSIGDTYLWATYFEEYRKKNAIDSFRIVVTGGGCKKAAELYGYSDIVLISAQDMDALMKYVMFVGEEETGAFVVSPWYELVRHLDLLDSWQGLTWHDSFSKYVFHLEDDVNLNFPSIWSGIDVAKRFAELGLQKGKTVILSPYANTVSELPLVFWTDLAKKLIDMNYTVATNVSKRQEAIPGTVRLEMPLQDLGDYFEYAGNFVGLRSGLCDIIGHTNCRQIVLYRDRIQVNSSELSYNDLHAHDIAPKAEQIIYRDGDIEGMIESVMGMLI